MDAMCFIINLELCCDIYGFHQRLFFLCLEYIKIRKLFGLLHDKRKKGGKRVV